MSNNASYGLHEIWDYDYNDVELISFNLSTISVRERGKFQHSEMLWINKKIPQSAVPTKSSPVDQVAGMNYAPSDDCIHDIILTKSGSFMPD